MTALIAHDATEQTVANWARLGVLFATPMAQDSPDLELLLLDTARQAPHNIRLFILGASWLVRYGQCVAKRRLARLVEETLEDEHLPVMGLLLDYVQQQDRRHRRRFAQTIAACHRAEIPGPLLAADCRNPALWPMIQQSASPLSRHWGRWLEEFAVRDDALRPPEWLADHNPALRLRALVSGELAATIMAEAQADGSVLQCANPNQRLPPPGLRLHLIRDAPLLRCAWPECCTKPNGGGRIICEFVVRDSCLAIRDS